MIAPTTNEEAAELLRQLAIHQANLEETKAARDADILEVTKEYAASIAESETAIKVLEETLALWAEQHPGLFEVRASVELGDAGKIGYTPGRWAVKVIEGTTEADAVNALKDIIAKGEKEDASKRAIQRAELAKFLVRSYTELDKKRCYEESSREEVLALLEAVGLYLEKRPKLYIKPTLASQTPRRRVMAAN